MLEQLKIENFRCFKSFELNHLGRVNLLVGQNNSGKTSVLEAAHLLYSGGNLESFKKIMTNRGEFIWNRNRRNLRAKQYAVSHLFYQHELDFSSEISISGLDDNYKKELHIYLKENLKDNESFDGEFSLDIDEYDTHTSLIANYVSLHKQNKIQEYGLIYDSDFWLYSLSSLGGETEEIISKLQYINSSSLTTQATINLFNQIVLQPEEDLVYQSLRNIEPNIERLASITSDRITRSDNYHRGFVVKLSNTNQRIPIGSMGDGIWRMLGIVLSLVSAKDGVLLVDEIDTGLHYTALEGMWKLIWETSKKLNVQVFATTHNSDCWKALEALTSREDVGEEDISIQRIEKDAPRSVAYNKEEIATAVEREIEVR